jgi:hypothetical protein
MIQSLGKPNRKVINMKDATALGTSITSVLTVGVGGVVAWAKRSISTLLKEAQAVREQATTDLAQIKSDLAGIQNDLGNVVANTTKACPSAH